MGEEYKEDKKIKKQNKKQAKRNAMFRKLRKYVKANGYTSYQGNGGNPYSEVEGIELYYYTSGILNKSEYTTNFKRNTNLGVNND